MTWLVSTRLPYSALSSSRRLFHSLKMASDGAGEVYGKAQEYWAAVASDVDGMLGGFAKLHLPDVNASKTFIGQLRMSVLATHTKY